MKIVSTIMLLLGFLLIFLAIFLTNGAPQQGALAGLACFFAIVARITQAESNHEKTLKTLKEINEYNKMPQILKG